MVVGEIRQGNKNVWHEGNGSCSIKIINKS